MKRIRDFFWPAIGLVAVVWSVRLLYVKMQAEVSADPAVKARLDALGLWGDVQVISSVIAEKLTGIPPTACLLYTSPSPRDRQKSRMPSSA